MANVSPVRVKGPGKMEDERGQGLVEYALILLLVAIAVIGLLTTLGGNVGNVFSDVSSTLTSSTSSGGGGGGGWGGGGRGGGGGGW